MEAIASKIDASEQRSSFGIKKIIDCKIAEDGQQLYKVKWQATWEPAESLVSCQHLIDEFWSFVNKVKNNEVEQQHRKRKILEVSTNKKDIKFSRMSDDNKAEVQNLIARADATSVGSLKSPSNMLMASPHYQQQNNLMGVTQIPRHEHFGISSTQHQNRNIDSSDQQVKFGIFGNKGNTSPVTVKTETDRSTEQSKQNLSACTASLKYLENFCSPYVKVIVVCKICNKEQSMKFVSYWRQHFMTHSDTKPHKCPHCPKTFTRPVLMRKHVQSKHPDMVSAASQQQQQMGMFAPKQEHMMGHGVKNEDYFY